MRIVRIPCAVSFELRCLSSVRHSYQIQIAASCIYCTPWHSPLHAISWVSRPRFCRLAPDKPILGSYDTRTLVPPKGCLSSWLITSREDALVMIHSMSTLDIPPARQLDRRSCGTTQGYPSTVDPIVILGTSKMSSCAPWLQLVDTHGFPSGSLIP